MVHLAGKREHVPLSSGKKIVNSVCSILFRVITVTVDAGKLVLLAGREESIAVGRAKDGLAD